MGYSCNNPKDLKDAILRRLGAPVINIEVTQDQIFDCIQRAMELYGEYHYDGTNRAFFVARLNEEQAREGFIKIESTEPILAFTKVLRAGNNFFTMDGSATYNWFSDFIQGLGGIGMGSCNYYGPFSGAGNLSTYNIVMMYMNQILDTLSPLPDFWFNSNKGQLKIFGNLKEGDVLVFEVYVKSFVPLDKSNGVIEGDIAPEYKNYDTPYNMLKGNTQGNYIEQNIYDNRWLKDYSTALVKQLWGSILAKHVNLNLAGNTTVDGVRILTEATDEIEKLRTELYELDTPVPIVIA